MGSIPAYVKSTFRILFGYELCNKDKLFSFLRGNDHWIKLKLMGTKNMLEKDLFRL